MMAGTRSRYSKIRWNRAKEVWTSSATRSRLITGKSSRVCSVVNATIVPALSSVPREIVIPATRYTMAGVTPKNVWTTAKNDWPVMVWRICRSTWRSFSAR